MVKFPVSAFTAPTHFPNPRGRTREYRGSREGIVCADPNLQLTRRLRKARSIGKRLANMSELHSVPDVGERRPVYRADRLVKEGTDFYVAIGFEFETLPRYGAIDRKFVTLPMALRHAGRKPDGGVEPGRKITAMVLSDFLADTLQFQEIV